MMQNDARAVLDPNHHLDAAYLAIAGQRPLPLGRYLVLRPTSLVPHWTYQAVVHDLGRQPSCRPGDVRRSLTAIFEDAARRGIRSFVLEPLGRRHRAGLRFDEMVEALDSAFVERSVVLDSAVRITLLLDDLGELEEISHLLRSRVLCRASRSFRTVAGDAAVVEVRKSKVRLHYRFVPGSLSGYLVTRISHVA